VVNEEEYGARRSQELLNERAQNLLGKAEGEVIQMLERGVTPEEYAQRIMNGKPDPAEMRSTLNQVKDNVRDPELTADPAYLAERQKGELDYARGISEGAALDARVTGTPESEKVHGDMQRDLKAIEQIVETGKIPPDQRASYTPSSPAASQSFG
jgi:hypothetical protein